MRWSVYVSISQWLVGCSFFSALPDLLSGSSVIADSEVLKFLALIMALSSPPSSVRFCLMYFQILLVGACILRIMSP